MQHGSADFRLLNRYQHGFPLVSQPFAAIGREEGLSEAAVLDTYRRLSRDGVVSRIGAVFPPRRLGASTLAAVTVPDDQIESAAAIINRHAAVNHNYQREHELKLWFVVTAADATARDAVLAEIAAGTGAEVLSLPLLDAFHIDLGFDLQGGAKRVGGGQCHPAPPLEAGARRLIEVLQEGLPLVPRPYARLAGAAGLDESAAIRLLSGWQEDGTVKRLGVVVHHRELGYTANAMCVWDVPDALVAELGPRLAAANGVTLCYRRQRALPRWRYNLFCMIHGRTREAVLAQRAALAVTLGLDAYGHDVLFSLRRFKQRGARYVGPAHG
ncbi:MAG: Lrp/AsnC family transcriptional regulator [Proteobacteria bacterium]|nr:Lrp/AsnC family transcriptional regulator [Pseudomonadota bacterium]HQR03500.1 Lrp/AsnC family transcriptional regulator [Rhodocyclaceae bacterium]